MSHYRDDNRVITSKETALGRKQRKKLCVEIGSLEFPYFSNSVRREITKAGLGAFSPKLSALMLQRKFERRDTLRYDMSLDRGDLPFSSKDIRKSMMMASGESTGIGGGGDTGGASGSGPGGGPGSSGDIPNTPGAPSVAGASRLSDGDQKSAAGGAGGDKTSADSTSKEDSQKKKLMMMKKKKGGDKKDHKSGLLEPENNSDFEDGTVDWSKRKYNPIFVKQKRKVASALRAMSRNLNVRSAVVRDGGVKALKALVRMYDASIDADLSDALCFLAGNSDSQSRVSMISDGAVSTIMSLAKRTKSNATRYSLALALGSLCCENGFEGEIIDAGALHALMEIKIKSGSEIGDGSEDAESKEDGDGSDAEMDHSAGGGLSSFGDYRGEVSDKDSGGSSKMKKWATEMDVAVGRALYNFSSAKGDHGRLVEVAQSLLAIGPSRGKGACRSMFFRSLACLSRTRVLHGMLVNGGAIMLLKDLVCELSTKSSQQNGDFCSEVKGTDRDGIKGDDLLSSVEAATIAITILCLLSSTPSIRVRMVEEGAILVVMDIASEALGRLQDREIELEKRKSNLRFKDSEGKSSGLATSDLEGSADSDIVCMAVAMLTNLSLNAKTRASVVSLGAVPVIIGLSQGSNDSIARACAAALRGLTSDSDTVNLIRIMHDGGCRAILRLAVTTRDVITMRNCALAMRNILSHTETLEELLNHPNMASTLTEVFRVLYALMDSLDADVIRYCMLSAYNLSCTTSSGSRLRLVQHHIVKRVVNISHREFIPMETRALCTATLLNCSFAKSNAAKMIEAGVVSSSYFRAVCNCNIA